MSKTQVYRGLLAILGIIGVSMQLYQDGFGMLLYYTVLSNILVFSFLLYLISWERKNGSINQNNPLLVQKAAVTMAITITFLVYHFLLAPKVKPEDYYNIRNFIVHYIVPVGLICDTLILDKVKVYRWFSPFVWTALPLAYFVFAIGNGLFLKWPIPGSEDSPFPYFFINMNKYGGLTVLKNALVILLAYVAVGYLLVFLKRFIGQRH